MEFGNSTKRKSKEKAGVLLHFYRELKKRKLAFFGLVFLIFIHLIALFGPYIAPYGPQEMQPRSALTGPSWDHPLGVDELGRDELTRLIYGARVSLGVGLAVMAMSVIVGTVFGALSGYMGGWIDSVLMRITDTFMSLPVFFLAISILAIFGGGILAVIVVIVVTSWMGVARLVRSEYMQSREEDFVTAAESVGAGDFRIIVRHILPHAAPSIIVAATLQVPWGILTESALSYLGLGIQPPTPTWGNMLMNAQQYFWMQPELAFYPGLVIFLTVLSYNFLGDGLRDILDPYQSKQRR